MDVHSHSMYWMCSGQWLNDIVSECFSRLVDCFFFTTSFESNALFVEFDVQFNQILKMFYNFQMYDHIFPESGKIVSFPDKSDKSINTVATYFKLIWLKINDNHLFSISFTKSLSSQKIKFYV